MLSFSSSSGAKRIIVSVLILSFILPSSSYLYAEDSDDSTTASNDQDVVVSSTQTEDTVETQNNSSSEGSVFDVPLSVSSSVDSSVESDVEREAKQNSSASVLDEEHRQQAPPVPATKFKKDNSQSKEAQLTAVREHLVNNNLPQEIIDRLDAYQASYTKEPESAGLISKIVDFFTGNTEGKKKEEKAKELSKKQPFKVEAYSGSINTASTDSFEQSFPNQKEKSKGLFQKLKNFIKHGTTDNADPDNTKNEKPVSWILGDTTYAASENPNDYLAEGNEITFSQAIQDKANALGGDPLSILNFVRNNIAYIPYYGSKKGSDATLVEQAGNDMDKASLLIALLRYKDIPARYRRVDARMDIGTVTDLVGVNSANAAAQVLSLTGVPYILYVDSEGNPLFFVIEYTYVEAYISYGYSRGLDLGDSGESQWVPMDPTINAYYYEQDSDVMGGMLTDGFNIETFFDNYLDGDYGTSTEPLAAFKTDVETYLAGQTPSSTYADALTRFYAKDQNLDLIPGSLPYEIAANINTYDYIPTSLRHTIEFTVTDDSEATVLNHTAYVSDLADKELLLTYDAASQADQDTLDTFDTIYDVVPLSLVAVKPKIKVNGTAIATGSASTTLGEAQSYTMEFNVPTRTIGGSISSNVVETVNRDVITGNTDAIALDTDKVTPPELRPSGDTETTSFVANQNLYKAGIDFLYRLENTQDELANVIGSDFTDTATRATIFNGIEITYSSSSEPYSFDWTGLRIDASSKVKYFNRFNQDTVKYKKEFTGVFGLQASQDESDIFEDNFDVESVATVKGLKLVADGVFGGITLHKINSSNENDIDSLTSIATTTRDIFHDAVDEGKTIYTPSAPVTYGEWQGLFYININFDGSTAGYIIGEGLNGGYTIELFPEGWRHFLIGVEAALTTLTATIVSPSNNYTITQGSTSSIPWEVDYTASALGITINSWTETASIFVLPTLVPGTIALYSGYGTMSAVDVIIERTTLGGVGNNSTFDQEIIDAVAANNLQPEFASVLKLMIKKESDFETLKMRYEPCVDKNIVYAGGTGLTDDHPYAAWRLAGDMPSGPDLIEGNQVSSLKTKHSKTPHQMINEFTNFGMKLDAGADGTLSIYDAWHQNDAVQNYSGNDCDASIITTAETQPAQLLLASSYGLGQVIYAYHASEFDQSQAPPAKDIWGMFARRANVNMSTYVFKLGWDLWNGTSGSSCQSGDRLWKAIKSYNGTGLKAQAYADDICGQYVAGKYKTITQ